jgi:hypothetical protein
LDNRFLIFTPARMPIPAGIYQKIVDAKVFIDEHFDSPIDLDAMAGI